MNPAFTIFFLIIAVVFVYATFSDGGLFGGPSGPLATGPGGDIRNPQPISTSGGGFFGTPTPAPQPAPSESPYTGKVRITTVSRSGDSPDDEYVIITYSGYSNDPSQNGAIDITGWSVGTPSQHDRIPQAYNIPAIDAFQQDILLPQGGSVIILSGTPDYGPNFRENLCVGYFRESFSFTPSLSGSCPGSSPNRGDLLDMGFNGQCIDTIYSVGSCRTPRGPFPVSDIGSWCVDYMNENFSYAGCVKNFRDSSNFLANSWRVALHRDSKFFDPRHDRAALYDRNGLLVDQFEY